MMTVSHVPGLCLMSLPGGVKRSLNDVLDQRCPRSLTVSDVLWLVDCGVPCMIPLTGTVMRSLTISDSL